MTSKILKAYIEYLEYPTIVVKFESLGFYSIDDFIEEGARLKSEYLEAQWFEDMPFLGPTDDVMDATRFSEEHLGTWDVGNDERSFEGAVNLDTSLSAGVITSDRITHGGIRSTQIIVDEITTYAITHASIYDGPSYYPPIEPPDTSCYRKYLNEIREKEVANKFILRKIKFNQKKIIPVFLAKIMPNKIRDSTPRSMHNS